MEMTNSVEYDRRGIVGCSDGKLELGGGGRAFGKGVWKGGFKSGNNGCRIKGDDGIDIDDDYNETRSFGEVLVTRTAMVDDGSDREDKKIVDAMV